MYRLRTADKGRPLIVSDQIVTAYADNQIDTLHKKNLLSLGEDRYLTTLMVKNFPSMSYKFVPDAYALTEAPAEWSVLLSQRRRWINSTIHNLAELVWVDLCGFCCFSMRFIVFIDLCGTIILPATCAYIVYLIYKVASHSGQFPMISIIMIAAVYGLQALIFIIKRQWQHVGWMIIYILAYPIWSFVLPVYSFWKQDDFSWGNTRVVIGEKGDKQLVAVDAEVFNPKSIPLQRWNDYAIANRLPGVRGMMPEKDPNMYSDNPGYEMDEMQSLYSYAPAPGTVLRQQQHPLSQHSSYHVPQSPSPFNAMQRQSTFSHMSRYTDHPTPHYEHPQSRLMSMGGLSDRQYSNASPFPRHLSSQDNLLMGMQSSPVYQRPGTQTPLPRANSAMSMSLAGFQTQGPTNAAISDAVRECLAVVNTEEVTKKQLRVLVEQKLQCQITGEKRAFLDQEIDLQLEQL